MPAHGADVGLGDPVVAAEDDRDRAGVEYLADGLLDRVVRPRGVGRQHGRVAVIDDLQDVERVDLRLQVRPGRAARGADRSRRETRAGAVADQISVGAPTIATSKPSSSDGSCVYGAPLNVSRPA